MSVRAGIEYNSCGDGPKTIVCLHGIGGSTASFAPQMDALSTDHRIISCNLPGFGRSGALGDLSFKTLAEKFEQFFDELDLTQVNLCGHSIGGMVAIEIAVRFPQRVASLALIGTTSAFGGRDPSFADSFLNARLAPLDQGQTIEQLAAQFVPEIVGPRAAKNVITLAIETMTQVPQATYRDIIACLVTFNRRDDIAAIKMPVCLIAGRHDQNAPAKTMTKMATRFPDATIHIIEDAGHLIHLEAADETNQILQNFYGSLM